MAARMIELDVKPELEIYDTGHVDAALRLLDEGLLVEPLQVSVVMGVRGGMAATPDNLVHTLRMLPESAIWQVIAIGRAHLPMTAIGLAMGGNVRTAMEDTLYMRRGELAVSNESLVERLVTLTRALDRIPSDVSATERFLGLAPRGDSTAPLPSRVASAE